MSPAPSMPLPAVMPMEASPKPPHSATVGTGMKNANLYANETLTSFFRRLTFTPDGSLLLTPSGQYQNQHPSENKDAKPVTEIINTVYIYTRGGINKPPVAHLPGHKKPSVVVKCSPVIYSLRQSPPKTKHITIDTSSNDEPIPSLPEPLARPSPAPTVMDPPPPPSTASVSETSAPKQTMESSSTPNPKSAFSLNYRIVYAVATQDSVLLYDTQQKTPICVVSNLHCATFTDLAWASDGLTLIISSSDGFCSTLSFSAGELGEAYKGEIGPPKKTTEAPASTHASAQNTPTPTPTTQFAPPSPFAGTVHHQHRGSASSFTAPSPPATASVAGSQRPHSPARSNSTSSVATQASTAVMSNPPLIGGSVPGIAATNSGKVTGVPITTPPETPRSATGSVTGTKRDASQASESEKEESSQPKKRRIAPTPVEKA